MGGRAASGRHERDLKRGRASWPSAADINVFTASVADDCDDIAAWGEAHPDDPRRLLPWEHGPLGARGLNSLMNRIDP